MSNRISLQFFSLQLVLLVFVVLLTIDSVYEQLGLLVNDRVNYLAASNTINNYQDADNLLLTTFFGEQIIGFLIALVALVTDDPQLSVSAVSAFSFLIFAYSLSKMVPSYSLLYSLIATSPLVVSVYVVPLRLGLAIAFLALAISMSQSRIRFAFYALSALTHHALLLIFCIYLFIKYFSLTSGSKLGALSFELFSAIAIISIILILPLTIDMNFIRQFNDFKLVINDNSGFGLAFMVFLAYISYSFKQMPQEPLAICARVSLLIAIFSYFFLPNSGRFIEASLVLAVVALSRFRVYRNMLTISMAGYSVLWWLASLQSQRLPYSV